MADRGLELAGEKHRSQRRPSTQAASAANKGVTSLKLPHRLVGRELTVGVIPHELGPSTDPWRSQWCRPLSHQSCLDHLTDHRLFESSSELWCGTKQQTLVHLSSSEPWFIYGVNVKGRVFESKIGAKKVEVMSRRECEEGECSDCNCVTCSRRADPLLKERVL